MKLNKNDKLAKLIINCESTKQEIDNIKLQDDKNRKEIKDYMDSNDIKELLVDDEKDKIIKTTLTKRLNRELNENEFDSLLTKEEKKECIDINYSIDMLKLKELIKEGKIEKNIIKQIMIKNINFNIDKINIACKNHDSILKKFKKCYSETIGNIYIIIKRVKRGK